MNGLARVELGLLHTVRVILPDSVGDDQDTVILEWDTRLEPISTSAKLAWPDGIMEEVKAGRQNLFMMSQ